MAAWVAAGRPRGKVLGRRRSLPDDQVQMAGGDRGSTPHRRHWVKFPCWPAWPASGLVLAVRLGMGLLGIHPVLRSEGEEVAVALMAVLCLGLLVLGMVAVALVAVRLRTGRRDR